MTEKGKEESTLKGLETYLLKTHNLYCNRSGLQYWVEYISDEVERLNSGSHRELAELELHRIAKDTGLSVADLKKAKPPALTLPKK